MSKKNNAVNTEMEQKNVEQVVAEIVEEVQASEQAGKKMTFKEFVKKYWKKLLAVLGAGALVLGLLKKIWDALHSSDDEEELVVYEDDECLDESEDYVAESEE